jgi:FAD synthase
MYERTLTIEFVSWIREQQRFSGREELIERISQDVAAVESALDSSGHRRRA